MALYQRMVSWGRGERLMTLTGDGRKGAQFCFFFFFLPIFLFVFLNYIKKGKYVSKIEGIDEQDGCREKYSERVERLI